MNLPDPRLNPTWQAFAKECSLIRQLVGSGITAIGSANYADRKGDYYVSFFALSVGMERLLKLILAADYSIDNGKKFPDPVFFYKKGHLLAKLAEDVDGVVRKRGLKLRYERPSNPIAISVFSVLDHFADARKGRYANLDALSNPSLNINDEPIQLWWLEVVEPILKAHFYGTAAEARVVARAEFAAKLMGDRSIVRHSSEDGSFINDIRSASVRTGMIPYIQKFSRVYILANVRWLSDVFYEITNYGSYNRGIEELTGHYEYFNTFRVGDEFIRNRKVWPLR